MHKLYSYNGKELVDDLDINLHDYGARYYDPAIARWTTIDPLADSYESFSPYNYVLNNPLIYIDPDGMAVDTVGPLHDEWTSNARDFIGESVKSMSIASQSVINYFDRLWQAGSGNEQTSGVPLEGEDGKGDVGTKSEDPPEEGVEVDGLMGIIKSKKPLSGKSMLFERAGGNDIMGMTKKVVEATKTVDKVRKGKGHVEKGVGAVQGLIPKKFERDTITVDSLSYSRQRHPDRNGQQSATLTPIKD